MHAPPESIRVLGSRQMGSSRTPHGQKAQGRSTDDNTFRRWVPGMLLWPVQPAFPRGQPRPGQPTSARSAAVLRRRGEGERAAPEAPDNTGGEGGAGRSTHRALVGLLARVPAHVHHQHVLRLEGLLLARAGLPTAHKLLLLPMDVLIVDVLPGRSARTGREPGHPPLRPPPPTCRTPPPALPTRPPPVSQATPPQPLSLAATNCRSTVCYSSQRHSPISQ